MSWKDCFDEGVNFFRASKLDDALNCFDKAIECGGNHITLYDSRAAVLEKKGKFKDALRDAKKTIDLGPLQWQGYSRSSRLFLKLRKYDAALSMADMAIERLKEGDGKRQAEVLDLKRQALEGQTIAAEQKRLQLARTFYHFGKLPLELSSFVFTLVVADDFCEVIKLSQICRHWRDIALSTPALWSTLVLSCKNPVAKAKTWSLRSDNRIRELYIREDLRDDWDKVWSALASLSWSCLRLLRTEANGAQQHEIISRFLSTPQGRYVVSNLDELEFINSRASMKQGRLPMHLLPALVQWRSLTLRYGTFDWEEASKRITMLTSLVAHQIPFPTELVFNFLKANPMLETISFVYRISPGNYDPLPGPLSLPHLKQLELTAFGPDVNEFLDKVAMPSLQTLKLASMYRLQDWSLIRLIEKGVQSLTELRIHECAVRPGTVVDFLHAAEALEVLELLSMAEDVNEVVEALAQSGPKPPSTSTDGTPLCPSLQHLNLSFCPAVKTGPIIRLVKSRLADPENGDLEDRDSAKPKPIKTLALDGCPLMEDATLPWLRSKVSMVSCVYMTKKAAKYKR